MATTGSINDRYYWSGWGSVIDYTVTLKWNRSSNSATGNYSTVTWELRFANNNNSNAGETVLNGNYSVTIEGRTYTGTGSGITVAPGADGLIASGNKTIYHDTDGTKTFNYSFNYTHAQIGFSASGTSTIDRIYRPATITNNPKFYDTANPIVKYSNPSGSAMSSVQIGISLSSGVTPVIAYRDVSLTGDSFTFDLTDDDRRILRQSITTGNSRTVYFRIKSIGGGSSYYREATGTLNLIDYTPLLAPTIRDINDKTVNLTGDDEVLVRYYSNAYIIAGATPRKEATITSVRCINDEQILSGNTGYMDDLQSYIFKFNCTDSRGYSTSLNYTVDWIPYIKLTSSLSTGLLSSNGALTFTIKGKYFNDTFGERDNTMYVDYGLSENGESTVWTSIGEVQPTMLTGEDYTYSYTITGLNYESQYDLTVSVADELTYTLTSVIVSATPVFDWGLTDFAFHVPVSIQGETITDFVVEQGDDGIWSYRKWSSGKVELDGYLDIQNIACNVAFEEWYRTVAQVSPSFPFSVYSPKVTINYESSSYSALVWQTSSASSDKPGNFYLIRPTNSSTMQGGVVFHVTGTWK